MLLTLGLWPNAGPGIVAQNMLWSLRFCGSSEGTHGAGVLR